VVESTPPATVYLDHGYIGRTPVRLREVREGVRRLEVREEGFESHERLVEISPRKSASISVMLAPVAPPSTDAPPEPEPPKRPEPSPEP
jgi:hypothetical protein